MPNLCRAHAQHETKFPLRIYDMLCVDMNRLVMVGAGMGKVTPGGVGNRARSFRDRMHTTRPRLYPNNLAICGDSYLIRDCRLCNIFCQCSIL